MKKVRTRVGEIRNTDFRGNSTQSKKEPAANTERIGKGSDDGMGGIARKDVSNSPTRVLIGLSWVYANGRMHIGHVASSLPADAIARFHRLIGNEVSFITGSDCYGTPILVAAKSEGITPEALANKYHALLKQDFESLGFLFDSYTLTLSNHHNEWVRKFHDQMYKGDYIFAETTMQLYCKACDKYLPDRYVEGICPHCKASAKGDSCDGCSKVLEPEDLLEPTCKLCSATPTPRETRQLYIALSKLQPAIQKYFDKVKPNWMNNAVGLVGRYLNEGLIDRAITRNIEWGVELPKVPSKFKLTETDLENKRIYIWAENVLGYLSATAEAKGEDFLVDGKGNDLLHYYVHAKDNVPFHGIILPGLLMANQEVSYHLPDVIVSSEYVLLNGKKMSKSTGNYLTAEDLVSKYDVDAIRYYFLRNVNDKKDVNFTTEDFVATVNAELVNGFSNLVNRTLSFIKSRLGGEVSCRGGVLPPAIESTYKEAVQLLTEGRANRAIASIMQLVDYGNKIFDEFAPWTTIKTDEALTRKNMHEVMMVIANLATLLEPFIPTAAKKLQGWLGITENKFTPIAPKEFTLGDFEILFSRISTC